MGGKKELAGIKWEEKRNRRELNGRKKRVGGTKLGGKKEWAGTKQEKKDWEKQNILG